LKRKQECFELKGRHSPARLKSQTAGKIETELDNPLDVKIKWCGAQENSTEETWDSLA
jgi:hypothetical protein